MACRNNPALVVAAREGRGRFEIRRFFRRNRRHSLRLGTGRT